MAAARRLDTEAYVAATAVAREVRATVAGQLQALVVEADRMSGREELVTKLERMLFCERRIVEGVGQEKQARVEGMPVGSAVRQQEEFKQLLREAVMGLAVACGLWAASMDYEQMRQEPPERREQAADDV